MNDEEKLKLAELLQRVDQIEDRNRRVELEKEWETSTARKMAILVTTYLAMCLLFWSLENPDPFKNAVVPAFGFFLSTLTLPLVREEWKRRRRRG